MLVIILLLFLIALVLTGLLWAGALLLQGWLYESPTPQLYWRAPAVGAGLAVFYALWLFVDCRTGGHCGSMYHVSVSTLTQYDQLRAVVKRNGKDGPEETYRKVGSDYKRVGPDGLLEDAKLPEAPESVLIEEDGALTVKSDGGEVKEFAVPLTARVTIDGKAGRVADLKPGDAVAVLGEKGGKVTAVLAAESSPLAAPPPAPATTTGKVVKAQGGATAVFKPERSGDAFKREPGQNLHYYDSAGRTLDEGDLGRVQQFHADWLVWNVVFNVLHLGLWFVGLWLGLRFQWAHALGFAVCLWLVMTLFPLPMILDFAEKAFPAVK